MPAKKYVPMEHVGRMIIAETGQEPRWRWVRRYLHARELLDFFGGVGREKFFGEIVFCVEVFFFRKDTQG